MGTTEENIKNAIKAWNSLGLSCKEASENIIKAFMVSAEMLSTPVDNYVDNYKDKLFKGNNPIKKN